MAVLKILKGKFAPAGKNFGSVGDGDGDGYGDGDGDGYGDGYGYGSGYGDGYGYGDGDGAKNFSSAGYEVDA